MIADAKRIVPFTGAGISTECGIPDFRSPGGYGRARSILSRRVRSEPEARDEIRRRRFAMEEVFAAAKPAAVTAHWPRCTAPARFPPMITQNIDNLHQASGLADKHVVELHGNTTHARCIGCGQAASARLGEAKILMPTALRPTARRATSR